MEVDLTVILSRKAKRTLCCRWSKLLDINRYKIPSTIEELDYGFNCLDINGVNHYFSEDTDKEIDDFSSAIFDCQDVKKLFCYDTIYKAVVSEISSTLTLKSKKDFFDTLKSISLQLSAKLEEFKFYFPVFGFRLSDLNEFSMGEVSVINFDWYCAKKILERSVNTHNCQSWVDRVEKSFEKHFIDKAVIVIPVLGDRVKAEEYAREKARVVVNYIRLVICLLAHKRIDENLVKISIAFEWVDRNAELFYESSNNLSLADDRGPRPLHAFEFSSVKLNELKEKAFFDDLCGFLFEEKKTELEKCIVVSIYWIGEAQNDNDRESSFLKYWIALENVFTFNRKTENSSITRNLCQGISSLILYSGYDFGEVVEPNSIYKNVSKLYDVRSDIVHDGAQKGVTYCDLSDICRYSSWIVLCLLWLRDYFGLDSVAQIRSISDNLAQYKDAPSTIEIKTERLNKSFFSASLSK